MSRTVGAHSRRIMLMVARTSLAMYLLLGVAYKLCAPRAVLAAMVNLPLIGSMSLPVQRALLGLLLAIELILALGFLVNRSLRVAAWTFCAFLIGITVLVAPHVGVQGCGCNWSWMPLLPRSPEALIGWNALLLVLAAVVAGSASVGAAKAPV